MSKLSERREEQAAESSPRWTWLALGVAVAVIAWGIYYFAFYRRSHSPLESFAQCLTARGTKMYGAWWCPHCADQKEMFAESFHYVNYVECSPLGQRTQTDVCKQAEIKTYPTWQFADGSRVSGTQPLAELSKKTGCPLP
jgi:hypothetical protein